MGDDNLRPLRKFSSFLHGAIQYQCVQTCYPNIPSLQPVDLCSNLCPLKPDIPQCSQCGPAYSVTPDPDFDKKGMHPQASIMEPEPSIMEMILANRRRKPCCHMDRCTMIDVDEECEPVCFEPCDAACTGQCHVNPECPNACEMIRTEQMKLKYRMWLAGKLNAIKLKYRAMATACLLRTRQEFVGEVQNYFEAAKLALGQITGENGEVQQQMIMTQDVGNQAFRDGPNRR